MPLSEAEKWLDHLGSCSPCYRDYLDLRAASRKRLQWAWFAVAAGILLSILVVGRTLFPERNELLLAQTRIKTNSASWRCSRIINAAPHRFKVMFLLAAISGLRIGEVTALKLSSLDFKRRLIHIRAALDYTTRKESTPKSAHSAAPLHMPELLEHHLRNWIEKHFQPNPDGYLFINANGRPFLSDNVVK